MAFNTSSLWIKIALFCLLLGALLFVIGFATTNWMVSSTTSFGRNAYGLWSLKQCDRRACNTRKIRTQDLDYLNWTAWYRATQVFECIGLICIIMALFIVIMFVFVDRMKKRSALIAIIAFSFVGVLATVIGYIVFATQFEDYNAYLDVGWSMGIAIAGSILTFVAGVMALIDLKK